MSIPLFKVGDLVVIKPPRHNDSIEEGIYLIIPDRDSTRQKVMAKPTCKGYYFFMRLPDGKIDWHYYNYIHQHATKMV
jgi:hypothetical protein